MTETDKLRALLDGRGVEHNDFGGMTEFTGANGRICRCYTRPEPQAVDVTIIAVPAEQAVDATLGRGECANVMPGRDVDRRMMFRCSECGAVDVNHFYPADWYESEHSDDEWVEYDGERINHCPNCGRRVKGEL